MILVQQETKPASGEFTESTGILFRVWDPLWLCPIIRPRALWLVPDISDASHLAKLSLLSALSGLVLPEGLYWLFSWVGFFLVPASHVSLARPLHLATKGTQQAVLG